MSVSKILALAGAIATFGTAAVAADLRLPPPPPPQVVTAVDTGWYLRGYLGMSNQFFNGLSHPDFLTANSFGFYDKGGFDSAPFGGVGIGYTVNNWLRFDLTGEYRGKAGFHALDNYFNLNQNSINTNNYTASKSEWSGSSMPISISAPGGALRPMWAPASVSRRSGSTISAISM